MKALANDKLHLTQMMGPVLNSLPNDKILDWSKLKAFADEKINVNQKLKSVLAWVENFVGKEENAGYQHFLRKEENAGYQHFLLFPQRFRKAPFSGLLKPGIVW